MDSKLLSYKDVVVWRSDVQSLEGHNHVTDTIIDFYFAYLSTWYQLDDILLVPTSISFLLANTRDWDIFIATIESLEFYKKKLILFTVNSASDTASSSGVSHWSLLVYCRKRNLFMHYDSLNMVNYEYAYSIYESVNSYISYDSAEFVESRAPRQSNGYDCGLYVMEIARAICDRYFNVEQFQEEDEMCDNINVMKSVSCKYVESSMRSELLQLLSNVNKEETNKGVLQ